MKRFLLTFALLAGTATALACTNFIVTKGASTDGSVMVTYAADSPQLYGDLYKHNGGKQKSKMMAVNEWDTGRYLGLIEQHAVSTYATVGNMNEHSLIITETTFGGRHELEDKQGIMDYGSLIYITLQRAKTAREAIATIVFLANKYGYASSGESFSIADADEAWIMELIGKGSKLDDKGNNTRKGIVWVARRIPDGYVSGHANQARISTFPLNDKENCLYAPDVISFAREQGYFNGKDEEFSFSDTYAPLDFGGMRACEARVWAFFRTIADDMDNGIHMAQTESVYGKMMGSKSGKDFFYNKVYIDAFIREGSSYPQARAKMFRLLDEGVLWWNYVGHANTTSWTGEGILSYTDMSNMYLKKYPMLYAATCDFLRWDANALSGAEVMYGNSSGGVIAAISATRPVYISNNGNLSNAIAPFILSRDDDGKYLTIGEIYRRGKNNLYDINGKKVSDRNKLRYVLMGDPAMRLAIPELVAKVDSINGIAVDSDEQKIIKSRQIVKITGHIAGIDGNIVTDFDGTINSTLYDAEKSTTSHGYTNGDDGKEVTFEE